MSTRRNLFDLTGKVAVVTGGNGGIGLGMAAALRRQGASVSVWGTNGDKLARAKTFLLDQETAPLDPINHQSEEEAAQVDTQVVDVSNEDSVVEAMGAVVGRFGHVDSCFANAGIAAASKSFSTMSMDQWRKVLAINLDGAFLTLREAAKHMEEGQRGGSLAVTSSLAAISGQPRGQHYAATKGAVIAMVYALAVELGPKGIRANAILPGWVETDMTAQFLNAEPVMQKVLPRVPVRRWGSQDDFGGVAAYLASDASAYHNGDVLLIDGGYNKF